MEAKKTEAGARKMGIVKKIFIGIGGVAALLLLVVATRPSKFHVARSTTVHAPAERVFAHVNDLHAWTAWSPYEKQDPQLARTYSGAPSGTGAIYAWSGEKVGEGRMTIAKSDKPSEIALKLEFIKPFECNNDAKFTFTETPEGTKVTWELDGKNNLIGKAFSLVVDMDKLVGGDFERGLADLKVLSEKSSNGNSQAANTHE